MFFLQQVCTKRSSWFDFIIQIVKLKFELISFPIVGFNSHNKHLAYVKITKMDTVTEIDFDASNFEKIFTQNTKVNEVCNVYENVRGEKKSEGKFISS